MRRTPRDTGDVPGHGRVGHVDVADEEEIQDIQRDALGDVGEARRHAKVYFLADDDTEHVHDLRADPTASLSVSDLIEHYAFAGEDDVLDLRDLWHRWNREQREDGQTFVNDDPRSLSAGDVAIVDGDAYRCMRKGWTSIELREVGVE